MDPRPVGRFNFTAGEVVLIDKPAGWSSFDVVKKIRNAMVRYERRRDPATNTRPRSLKVGHAGTLDPLATGLLIICTGRRTRDIASFQEGEKEYTGTFFIGATTPSYDLETEPVDHKETGEVTPAKLKELASRFTGTIMQVPPAHSAVMSGGTRAYAKARKGEAVRLEPRPVLIRSFEIGQVDGPLVGFRVVCGKGTYIRSLAHDFGQALGTGAYLHSLSRTRIGDFLLADACSPTAFVDQLDDTGATG